MSNNELKKETCRECGKGILVCDLSPHERAGEATGISASRWDSDRETDYFVGWICLGCALDLCNVKQQGMIAGGGVGVGEWSFCY